jgi:DNA (cytosine-5)-methyltransferase 1
LVHELRVRRLLVENVPEFVDWGPLDLRTGKPIKRRRGEYFRASTAALQGAGFKVEWRILNAADFGDATTRERFFLMARSDGKRIHWPDSSHSRAGEADLLGHGRHKWRAAREIIDWSIEGKSIFDRKRPLSPKSLARIYTGAVKFRWPQPFLVILRQHMDAQSLDAPLSTICACGTHIGLAQPFLLNRHGDNGSVRAHDLAEPMPTADCRGAGYVVEPFILSQASGGAPRIVAEPVQTIVAGGAHALIAPYYSSGSGETCSGVSSPLPTVTTKARFGLVMPVTHGGDGQVPIARGAASHDYRRAPRGPSTHGLVPRGARLHRSRFWRAPGTSASSPLDRRADPDDLRHGTHSAGHRRAGDRGTTVRHPVPHARAERARPGDGLHGRGDGV